MKKILVIVVMFFLLFSWFSPVMAYTQVQEYLCDIGVKFYNQGRYAEALQEFKKVLVIDSGDPLALKYIRKIQAKHKLQDDQSFSYQQPDPAEEYTTFRDAAIGRYLEAFGAESNAYKALRKDYPQTQEEPSLQAAGKAQRQKSKGPGLLLLNDDLERQIAPTEIPEGSSFIVSGTNIRRFLVTHPEIIDVVRQNPDQLLVTGKNIGYTDLVAWDDRGRWTVGFLGVFPQPQGESYKESLLREEEGNRSFKLRYSFDFTATERGSRLYNLRRQGSYAYTHSLGLSGQSPYGNIDSAVTFRRFATTELTYATLGLTDGKYGPFEGFSLRGGDLTPDFYNLAFPSTVVRGAMFTSPAFEKKFNYTLFWGRESGGLSGLFPDLYKQKNSFLTGSNFSYTPDKVQNYQFSVLHGWGRDRDEFLNEYGYDLSGKWNLENNWGFGYELGYDSKKFAQLLNANYVAPNIRFSSELRDINSDYVNMVGTGWRQGELGTLFNLDYKATDKLRLTSRFDFYRDRLFPALDNKHRWNQDFDWDAVYQIDPVTDVDFSYSLQNDLGKLSQVRYFTPGVGISRRFDFLKGFYTFFKYSYAKNRNFTSPSLDYFNNRVTMNLRLGLTDDLYYYFNKEINWLYETYNKNHSMPNAYETGLDWSNQFWDSPVFATLRFSYRDEEDAASPLSFLSGQDYIEGYSELTYRGESGNEIYGSCRIRNSWADEPSASKGIDANFNTGLRYVWDTGFSWNAACDIEVYAFKDLNSDGLRQRNEPPVEGAVILLGKKRKMVTDLFGFCNFRGVRGNRAFVSYDLSSLPNGYLLTVPQTQEVGIIQGRTQKINFGIISRSGINGMVFVDPNQNGRLDTGENGIEGVKFLLENGQSAVSDNNGRYSFSNVPAGKHTLNIDINSIPVDYIPRAPLVKNIDLYEGVTYVYNLPLERVNQ